MFYNQVEQETNVPRISDSWLRILFHNKGLFSLCFLALANLFSQKSKSGSLTKQSLLIFSPQWMSPSYVSNIIYVQAHSWFGLQGDSMMSQSNVWILDFLMIVSCLADADYLTVWPVTRGDLGHGVTSGCHHVIHWSQWPQWMQGSEDVTNTCHHPDSLNHDQWLSAHYITLASIIHMSSIHSIQLWTSVKRINAGNSFMIIAGNIRNLNLWFPLFWLGW